MMIGVIHAVRGLATKSLTLISGTGIILILQKLRPRVTYRKLSMLGHKSTEDGKVLQYYVTASINWYIINDLWAG